MPAAPASTSPPPPSPAPPAIAVIGGTGLYEIDGFVRAEEIAMKTPFGAPSDAIVAGDLGGRRVLFLPRHGRGHSILPHEINHRANVWALRQLGARWAISVSAVGSLRGDIRPRDAIVPDQLYDRTSRRESHTFFGEGIAAHVAFGDPFAAGLREILLGAAGERMGNRLHDGGALVTMDGPAFSTRAESEENRRRGFALIGMTTTPEAKLCREAEIAYATLCMCTDYDCWHAEEEAVSVDAVIGHLQANAAAARDIVAAAIGRVPAEPDAPEHRALDAALVTDRALWPAERAEALRPILGRFL